MEAEGTLIAPKLGESSFLLQAALAAEKRLKKGDRDHICSGLGSEDMVGEF